ncbi:MAG: hypothetical protein KME04_08210 [Pleurocapsa minor GSE-CHR-MK-17-07R]|nr:hypothetical protein [Pleurocapsa minor GSE-CHR-MK 17-07R]
MKDYQSRLLLVLIFVSIWVSPGLGSFSSDYSRPVNSPLIAFPVEGECTLASQQLCATGIGIFNPDTETYGLIDTENYDPLSLDWSASGILYTPLGTNESLILNPDTHDILDLNLGYASAWSHDGLSVASLTSAGDGTSEILITDLATSRTSRIVTGLSILGRLVWSADDRLLAFTVRMIDGDPDSDELYIVHADGRQVSRVTSNAVQDFGPHWSPVGNRLLYLTGSVAENRPRYTIAVYDLDDQQGETLVDGSGPRWVLNGDAVLFRDTSEENLHSLQVMDLRDRSTDILVSKADFTSLSVAPNGDDVLYLARETDVSEWELCTFNLRDAEERCFDNLPVYVDSVSVWEGQ